MGLTNLVEIYIKEILLVKDITDEYATRMKRFNSDFFIEEPIYEVTMNVDCYGNKESVVKIWTKSEYETNVEKGYYML